MCDNEKKNSLTLWQLRNTACSLVFTDHLTILLKNILQHWFPVLASLCTKYRETISILSLLNPLSIKQRSDTTGTHKIYKRTHLNFKVFIVVEQTKWLCLIQAHITRQYLYWKVKNLVLWNTSYFSSYVHRHSNVRDRHESKAPSILTLTNETKQRTQLFCAW